jgi:hypothetical protein
MSKMACLKVFQYDELPPEAQETARQWFACKGFDFWDEPSIEDAKACGAKFGIEVEKVYYSGFWNQGDGACFEGSYSFKKGGVKAIKEHAPQDSKLHRIALALSKIQKRFFYGISATVRHEGHYSHEHCTRIFVENSNNPYDEAPVEVQDEVAELLRDFMRWIYRQLESEYEYQASDESVAESIRINEYEFYLDGERAWFGRRHVRKFIECGSCGAYHPEGFEGDCRDNENSFPFPPDGAEVVTVEDQLKEEAADSLTTLE